METESDAKHTHKTASYRELRPLFTRRVRTYTTPTSIWRHDGEIGHGKKEITETKKEAGVGSLSPVQSQVLPSSSTSFVSFDPVIPGFKKELNPLRSAEVAEVTRTLSYLLASKFPRVVILSS